MQSISRPVSNGVHPTRDTRCLSAQSVKQPFNKLSPTLSDIQVHAYSPASAQPNGSRLGFQPPLFIQPSSSHSTDLTKLESVINCENKEPATSHNQPRISHHHTHLPIPSVFSSFRELFDEVHGRPVSRGRFIVKEWIFAVFRETMAQHHHDTFSYLDLRNHFIQALLSEKHDKHPSIKDSAARAKYPLAYQLKIDILQAVIALDTVFKHTSHIPESVLTGEYRPVIAKKQKGQPIDVVLFIDPKNSTATTLGNPTESFESVVNRNKEDEKELQHFARFMSAIKPFVLNTLQPMLFTYFKSRGKSSKAPFDLPQPYGFITQNRINNIITHLPGNNSNPPITVDEHVYNTTSELRHQVLDQQQQVKSYFLEINSLFCKSVTSTAAK